MKFKLLIKIIVFFCLSVSLNSAWAKEPVYFDGLSFAGDYKDMQYAAPFAASLINDNQKLRDFNQQLRNELKKVDWGDFYLEEQKGNVKSGEALTISISVIEEQYQEEDTGDGSYSISGTVYGQIVVFDFTKKRTISTIPFATSYYDTATEVFKNTRQNIYEILYFDQTKKINVINEFVRKFPEINFKRPFHNWNIQVRDVTNLEKAKKTINKYGASEQAFKSRVANQFSTALSDKFQIPILPYSSGGQAVKSMALCFSSTKVLQLELPMPNFYIDLTVRGFKKKTVKETQRRIFVSYISAMGIAIGNRNFKQELFSEKAQVGLYHEFSKKLKVNDWNELKNSLTLLTEQVTEQLANPNTKFFKTNMFSKNSFSQFKKNTAKLEKKVFSKLR
jgi:hypothetical protein